MTDINAEVNITVLGTTGTGKSCYLYAMASEMMKLGGCAGFVVQPKIKDAESGKWMLDNEAEKELTDSWRRIKVDKIWPKPTTDDIKNYTFQLIGRDNRSIFTFRWVDYRGGVLNESNADYARLVERLTDSHSVVICLPADKIISNSEKIRSMCETYEKALMSIGRPKPLCIMVCKKDLCPGAQAYRRCVDIIKTTLFSKYFSRGACCKVAVIPVQIGQNLCVDKGRIVGMNGNPPIIKPMNVQMPIFYSVYTSMEQRIAEYDATIDGNGMQICRINNGKGLLSGFLNLTGINSLRITALVEEIAVIKKQKECLQFYIDQLKEVIDNCNRGCGENIPVQIYSDGKIVNLL